MGARKLEYYQKKGALERPPNFDFEVLESSKPRKKEVGRTYQYGFNGIERDDQVSGSGNSYTTYWRQYDPRLGRWKSNEPKPVAWESTYSAFRNSPIALSDPNGDWPKWLGGKGKGNHIKNNRKSPKLPRADRPKKQSNWNGLANLFRNRNLGPSAGRRRNMGWTSWSSNSVATRGNPIDRTANVNLFRQMADAAGDSRVSMTGIEVNGTAPSGTSFRVSGGLSQGSQRTLFASNGLQNILNPSHLHLLSSTELGSPFPIGLL